jgi:MFS family permease
MYKINNDFNKLWFGETVSMFGAQISMLAIPLLAVMLLEATPMEMGILTACGSFPFFLFSLFIGAIVDNHKRKPLLIIANIGSFTFLTMIVSLYWFSLLTMNTLYILQFLLASMAVLFELTYLSYVPSLVDKDKLSTSNSKLEGSRAVAQMGGPGIGGILVEILSAPFALITHACSYVVSTISLLLIKKEEQVVKSAQNKSVFGQIKEGLSVLVKNKVLLSITSTTALLNSLKSSFSAVYIIYVVEMLSINSSLLGIIVGIGSVGALIGASITTFLTKKVGIGKSILTGCLFYCLGIIIVPFIPATPYVSTVFLIIAQFFTALGGTIYFISQVTLRQTITPNNLLGRVNASNRFISRSFAPFGALLGGALASFLSVKMALLIIAVASLIPIVFMLASPIMRIHSVEDATDKYKIN